MNSVKSLKLENVQGKGRNRKKFPFFVNFQVFCQSLAHSTSMKLATEEIGYFHLYIYFN